MPSKVLVVDDDPSSIEVIKALVKEAGYEVFVAYNGNEALSIFDQEKIDIVLLDLAMPGMNGFETCKRIKLHQTEREVPVIFVSAKEDEINKVIGFEMGAVDYVTKPVKHSELQSRISLHLKIAAQKQRLNNRIQELHNLLDNGELANENRILKRQVLELKKKLDQTSK